MKYYVYLRTFYTMWEKSKKQFDSLEETYDFLDTITDYTDYMIIGREKNVEPYTSIGKIDKPLVKNLKNNKH